MATDYGLMIWTIMYQSGLFSCSLDVRYYPSVNIGLLLACVLGFIR